MGKIFKEYINSNSSKYICHYCHYFKNEDIDISCSDNLKSINIRGRFGEGFLFSKVYNLDGIYNSRAIIQNHSSLNIFDEFPIELDNSYQISYLHCRNCSSHLGFSVKKTNYYDYIIIKSLFKMGLFLL